MCATARPNRPRDESALDLGAHSRERMIPSARAQGDTISALDRCDDCAPFAGFVSCLPRQAMRRLILLWTIDAGGVRSLQLGLGRSVIVDLPEDATEIFVGEPKIANAIVRSARRLYISTLSPGQTTIFAIGASGRKIAVLEISVGRDVGELFQLLKAAIPDNDIRVRTVGELDYPDRLSCLRRRRPEGSRYRIWIPFDGIVRYGRRRVRPRRHASAPEPSGRIVNALTIRGLDQVSLRVTVTEIRREIIKQLGVNFSGVGGKSGLTSFNVTNPFSVSGILTNTQATLGWAVGASNCRRQFKPLNRQALREHWPNQLSPQSLARAPSSWLAARYRSRMGKAARAEFVSSRLSSSPMA